MINVNSIKLMTENQLLQKKIFAKELHKKMFLRLKIYSTEKWD